jgi:hypothetical protein
MNIYMRYENIKFGTGQWKNHTFYACYGVFYKLLRYGIL